MKGSPARWGSCPPGVEVRTQARGRFDIIVVFATKLTELERRFAPLAPCPRAGRRLWVAWPKQASGVTTELRVENVQCVGLNAGLVDNKSCAINDTWSGLWFVYRVADRAALPTRRSRKGA